MREIIRVECVPQTSPNSIPSSEFHETSLTTLPKLLDIQPVEWGESNETEEWLKEQERREDSGAF